MKIKEFICLLLLAIMLSSCLTPNKLKDKKELDKFIVSNFEKDLMKHDTLIFESLPIWCGNTGKSERLATFEPIGKDSNFMFEIENQLSQKIYFSDLEFKITIDSSYNYFYCDGEIRRRNKLNSVVIGGLCISRKKIRVIETYNIDTSRRRFNKIYQYKKGNWKLIKIREYKQN